MGENKVVPAPETKILELETATGSLVGSIHEVNAHAVETVKNLKMTKESVVVSETQQKTLQDKISSLSEEPLLIHD